METTDDCPVSEEVEPARHASFYGKEVPPHAATYNGQDPISKATKSSTGSETRATTRAGRVVKPPHRLKAHISD